VDVGEAPNCLRLFLLGFLSAFSVDWSIRQFVGSNVSLFYVKNIPIPSNLNHSFLAHSALRLSCNHKGYASLLVEQLGSAAKNLLDSNALPILKQVDERWKLRACIDAAVAYGYGLDRQQYEHVLFSFSHSNYPKAPYLCLEAFDELKEIGPDKFAREYDPFWEIPLSKRLPEPVIDLSIPEQRGVSLGPLFDGATIDAMVQPEPPIRTSASTAIASMQPRVSAAPSISSNGVFSTIAELLHSCGVITSSDAQQATGLDAAGVRPHLQQLVQQGLAVTEGQRRGMRYRRLDG
jgi:hypothetical protein